MKKLTVIDLFCGAGGFSEGFRQQGYEIILGIDSWEPAIKTFNHNFSLNCKTKNILDFETSIEDIENLPNSDIILGSPPCVTFSSSNKSGKADKALGIRLTEVFLRIVAIKKHKKNSTLKAWFMENVSNSVNYLNDKYTFRELNLAEWAMRQKLQPEDTAIVIKDNYKIINAADYGSPQVRKRAIAGEIIDAGGFKLPPITYRASDVEAELPKHLSLKVIIDSFPAPNTKRTTRKIIDPLYQEIVITADKLTDHFYDTGLYECEWKQSRYLKLNHPYMGKMAFPENENRPSRTITATKIGTSREAIIYKSEYSRQGNGEFRTPTIRESASIMGFPITYQFLGTEGIKYRLVGNAVCPSVSRALAKCVRKEMGLKKINQPTVIKEPNLIGVNNLNTFSEKKFTDPPKRNKGSRFRRHPFKDGNITVTLSNYDIEKNEKTISNWITSVQYGNGNGFPTYNFPNGFYRALEPLIAKLKDGEKFLDIINNGFSDKIAKHLQLQDMYENQSSKDGLLEPTELIEEVKNVIEGLDINNEKFYQRKKIIFKEKDVVPAKQLFALYAINKISTITNK